MPDSDSKVLIQFERSANYRLVAADGAWGGPTPRGHIIVNFFVDVPVAPLSVTHALSGDGQLGPEVERTPAQNEARPRVSREFEVGVLLSPDDAESIANWMLDQVDLVRGGPDIEDE